MSSAVVYVHGLWMTGIEGALLRRRLVRELGAAPFSFAYRSVRCSLAENVARMREFLARLDAREVHIVAHSLGGVITWKFFEQYPDMLPPGRVVLLGSPLQGSRAAATFARVPGAAAILGRCVREELIDPAPRQWSAPRALGVIAGTLSLGLGKLVGTGGAPNDGTVYVAETRVPGMTDHLALAVSHTQLPFSAAVARQVAAFLRSGRFAH
jgi:pimeloyl-ACP methyl ester carboxylesterase